MPRYSNYGSLDNLMVDEGDVAFTRINARLRPDQLQPSEIAMSSNGRMDINGAWQTRKGHQNLGSSLATDEASLTLPFYVYANTTSSGSSRSGDTITITFSSAHPFIDQTLGYVSGITGLTPDPNGNRVITVVDSVTIEIVVSGVSGTIGGTAVVGSPILNDNVINAVYSSCLFSDPASNNEEYIVIATNSIAYAVNLRTGTATSIDYPAGLTLDAEAHMVQAFNYVFIFRDGKTALEWDGDFTGTPAFQLVANGDYTQPVYLNAATNTAIADGVVTVSETGHGLSVDDIVYVVDKGSTELVEGEGYLVYSVPNANGFKVYAQVADSAATAVVWSKKVSVGAGFSHMPAPPWAVYHQRRLWMPFLYTTTGSSGSPTITSRDVTDEIIASDVLDQDTYDQIYANYRIASGGADYVVALQPFTEDNLVVFNRNTIHLVRGVSGALESTTVQEVTREVGCIARRSVVQVGNQILFLSDNGVYAMTFEDLYNLRGATIPLSEPINPLIKRINKDYAKNCVAIYHDNRYYIAVPFDDSTENNAILVYNFLNQGWESLDTVDVNGWNVRNLIRAGAGSLNKLYAVNSFGGIHVLEDREDNNDVLITQIGESATAYPIQSYMTTRQYTAGTMDRKRYNSFELQAESSDSNVSDIDVSFEAENPDSVNQLDSLSDLLGETLAVSEDASVRGRIGNIRGYGGQLTLTPTLGRPKIRAVRLTSQLTNLNISSKQ
jgi:hypothetical protein